MTIGTHSAPVHRGNRVPTARFGPAILTAGRRPAPHNARALRAHNRRVGVTVFNLVSRPGSGVSSLLSHTRAVLGDRHPMLILDNRRPANDDGRAVDDREPAGADALARFLAEHRPGSGSLVFLDSRLPDGAVADSDLGETLKLVICDVTAHPDLPLHRPERFADAELMVITKADLLRTDSRRVGRLVENARRVKPGLRAMPLSTVTGEGVADWLQWVDTARMLGLEAAE